MTSFTNTTPARDPERGVAWSSLAGLLLTSVHHAYGGYVYRTPWRYHVVLVAAPAAAVILGARAVARARPSGLLGAVARWTFGLTALVLPVILIGAFEGFYNHLVKDVLYFAGLPAEQMARLFPPPRYEMPNDAFFEITGVLQVVPAALTARDLFRMVAGRATPRRSPSPEAERASAPRQEDGAHAANA